MRTNKQEQKPTLLFHRNQVQIKIKWDILQKDPLFRRNKVKIDTKYGIYYK